MSIWAYIWYYTSIMTYMSSDFLSVRTDSCIFSSKIYLSMYDDPLIFWENVKREIKAQNTTQEWLAKNSGISFNTLQGWMSKGIYPRVNEAIRIAVSLNSSVEYLVSGSVQDNKRPVDIIFQAIPQIQEHLENIKEAIKELK